MHDGPPWWSHRWLWWCVFGVCTSALLGSLTLSVASGNVATAYIVASTVWAPLGLIIWYRKPDHPMGPLITLVGLLSLAVVPGFLMGAVFTQFPATIEPRAWPMIIGSAVSGAYTYLFLVAILLFPDGRARPGLQLWLTRLLLLAMLIATASGILAEPLGSVSHPFASLELTTAARSVFEAMVEIYGFGLLAVIVFKVVDYRRSYAVRQAQLKWLVYVLYVYLAFTIISFGIIGTAGFNLPGLILDALFTGLIPLAMALAILRYRLYEIDRLISRTVTYAAMFLLVAAMFALPVLVLPTMLGRTSEIAVAGTTLVIAAIFAPIRSRLQSRVDKRFNRARFDTEQEIATLAKKLNHTLSTEMLTEETVQLVSRTLHPSSIGIWIKG
jgi:hypothetical protein